jgi:hypothetical protein
MKFKKSVEIPITDPSSSVVVHTLIFGYTMIVYLSLFPLQGDMVTRTVCDITSIVAPRWRVLLLSRGIRMIWLRL